MEVECRSVVFAVAKPTSHLLDHLDLAVEAFGCGVGDVMLEVGQDICQVSMQNLGQVKVQHSFFDEMEAEHRQNTSMTRSSDTLRKKCHLGKMEYGIISP